LAVSTGIAQEEREPAAQFIWDFRPGSFLFSPDLDGFKVSNGAVTEKVDGTASYAPSINAGVGFKLDSVDLDITGGLGGFINSAFTGGFGQLDVAALFEFADGKLRLGPHVGYIHLTDADWKDNASIDLEGNAGFKGGLTLRAGSKRVAFLANLDYVDVAYDIKTYGWTATDKNGTVQTKLDMSGLLLDLGLILRF
jgi:hypothetical protein